MPRETLGPRKKVFCSPWRRRLMGTTWCWLSLRPRRTTTSSSRLASPHPPLWNWSSAAKKRNIPDPGHRCWTEKRNNLDPGRCWTEWIVVGWTWPTLLGFSASESSCAYSWQLPSLPFFSLDSFLGFFGLAFNLEVLLEWAKFGEDWKASCRAGDL